jgi:hypothetical protein
MTRERPTDLLLESSVVVTGILVVNDKTELFYQVKKYAIREMLDEIRVARGIRNRLETFFQTSKGIKYLKPIRAKKPPKSIKNIALLVLPNSEPDLNRFMAAYKIKCGGGIFIYHLTNQDVKDLRKCLEYFSKYHQIDLVCLMTENISNNHLALISSKVNIQTLKSYNRYTVSVCSTFSDNLPTTSLVSNKIMKGYHELIDFVYQNQKQVYLEVNMGFEKGRQILYGIIAEWEERLEDVRMDIEVMGKPITLEKNADKSIETIKYLLLISLSNTRTRIRDRMIEIMTVLVRHPSLISVMRKTIENIHSERKIENNTPCDILTTLMNSKKDGHK